MVDVDFMSTLTTILALVVAVPPPSNPYNAPGRALFDSIRQVESGGARDPGSLLGDSGASLGPYQIQRAAWADALEYDPSIGGTYQDCRNQAYAERVMVAYWSRYAPNWKPETLARIHNGGPAGHRRKATLGYWLKVQRRLP
jgi:hypothetical protein